jgi:hypothetical protein
MRQRPVDPEAPADAVDDLDLSNLRCGVPIHTQGVVPPGLRQSLTRFSRQDPGAATIPGCPHDVAISGNYAYVVNGDPRGLEVLDITGPEEPICVGHLDMPAAGCITIADSHACVTGGSHVAVFRIIDLEDPRNPRAEGSVQLRQQGNAIAICREWSQPKAFACVAVSFPGLILVDIANHADPRILSTIKTCPLQFRGDGAAPPRGPSRQGAGALVPGTGAEWEIMAEPRTAPPGFPRPT